MKKLLLSLFLISSAVVTLPSFMGSQTNESDLKQQLNTTKAELKSESEEEPSWSDIEFSKFLVDDRFENSVNANNLTATINTEDKFSNGIGYLEGRIYGLIKSTLGLSFPKNIDFDISSNFVNNDDFKISETSPLKVNFITLKGFEGEEFKSYDKEWTFTFTGLKKSEIDSKEEAAALIDTTLTTYNLSVDSPFKDVELFAVDQIKNNLKHKNRLLPNTIQLTLVDSFRNSSLYPDEIIEKNPNEKYNNFELKIRDTESGTEVIKKIILNNIEKLKLSFETETDVKNNLTLLKISNFEFIKDAGMIGDFSIPLFNPISKDEGKARVKEKLKKANTKSTCVSSEIKTNCWDSEEGIFYINNNSVNTDEVEVTFPSINGFFGEGDKNESKTIISLNPVVIKDNTLKIIIIFSVIALVILIIFSVIMTISTVVRKRNNKIKLFISDEDVERYKKNGLSKKFVKSLRQVVRFNEVEKAGFESGMDLVQIKKKAHKAEKVWLDSYQLTEKQLKMKKMSPKKLMGIEAFLSENGSKKIKKKIEKWQNKQ